MLLLQPTVMLLMLYIKHLALYMNCAKQLALLCAKSQKKFTQRFCVCVVK